MSRRSTAKFADQEPDFPGQCAAANRAGTRCRKHAEPGRSVCSLHGGKSLQGIGHPAYRHGERVESIGRYSLSDAQERQYERFLAEREELLKSYDEIALLVSRVQELLLRHWNATDEDWGAIVDTIDRISRLRSVEVRRIALGQEWMSADQAKHFMQRMMQIAIDVCKMAPTKQLEIEMRNYFAAEVGKLAYQPNVG